MIIMTAGAHFLTVVFLLNKHQSIFLIVLVFGQRFRVSSVIRDTRTPMMPLTFPLTEQPLESP